MSQVDPSTVPHARNSLSATRRLSRRHAVSASRKNSGMRLLGALAAVLMFGVAQNASALIFPTPSGTGCSIGGSTKAESGNPGALASNAASFTTGCSGQVQSNGIVQVPVTTDAGPNLYSFVQAATTQATAVPSLGSVGAFSSSSSTSTPEAYFYSINGNGAAADNLYVASGSSSANASWWDTLTIGGIPNANGFVVLAFALDLSGSTSTSPVGSTAAIGARLFIDDDSRFNGQILGLSEPGTVSSTIGFRPGQQVIVYGDIQASSSSRAGREYVCVGGFFCSLVPAGYNSTSDATASALNTAGFRIDVLTPGGAYTSASGETYVTAVPEPAAVWSMGLGLLALVGFARRKAR